MMTPPPNSEGCHRLARNGFTFIEIMVVVALWAALGGLVFKTLSQGLRIWQRSQQVGIESDIAIFFEKLEHDLLNAFRYTRLPFEGKEYSLAFASFVDPAPGAVILERADAQHRQMGKVEYSFDLARKCIIRRQSVYPQALLEHYDPPRTLVEAVEGLKFRYYFNPGPETMNRVEYAESIPSVVEVEVFYRDLDEKKSMRKTLALYPSGG